MSKTFTASNKMEIEYDASGMRLWYKNHYYDKNSLAEYDFLGEADIQALREYFQHERDEELGRWRWPDNLDYVVIQDHSPEDRYVVVLYEPSGHTYGVWEDSPGTDTDWRRCAEEYFAAHPEPKPWHDAKPKEIWALTGAGGLEQTWVRTKHNTWVSPINPAITYSAESAIAGRRIWPEGE